MSATQQLNYTAKAPGGKMTFTVDLTLTYDTNMNRDGSNDVTGVSGTYTVTHMKRGAPVTKSYTIERIREPNHLGQNDNKIFLDSPFPIVDRHGITFIVSEKTRALPKKAEEVNLFYNPNTKSINQYGRFVASKTSIPAKPTNSTNVFDAPVVEADACYAAGTRIATERGEVAVEALVVGDRVVTSSGALRDIRWLGHRDVDCRRHPRREAALPIRITAHAFGENRPARDLFVSPGHSICVEAMGEALIPAGALVNGTTIMQVEVESVQYWHVELERHDVIFADNLPAESYLEMGNRGFFAESGIVALAAIPDAKIVTHADFCRPFHADGPLVEAVRARLAARAKTAVRHVQAA